MNLVQKLTRTGQCQPHCPMANPPCHLSISVLDEIDGSLCMRTIWTEYEHILDGEIVATENKLRDFQTKFVLVRIKS